MHRRCPGCDTDLEYQDADGSTLNRAIGVNVRGVFDGVLFWECPACGHRWHRFEPDDRRYGMAVPHVGRP